VLNQLACDMILSVAVVNTGVIYGEGFTGVRILPTFYRAACNADAV